MTDGNARNCSQITYGQCSSPDLFQFALSATRSFAKLPPPQHRSCALAIARTGALEQTKEGIPMHAAHGRFRFLIAIVAISAARVAQSQLVQQPVYVAPPTQEVAIVESATGVLNEIMSVPNQGIPGALLRDAQGIAIVPGMLKGGFVIGVRHGNGVVVLRDEAGNWRPPSFISITGGSIGWQAGVQSTDVVLVFKTKNSINRFASGKFTIGGDVSAAAGPVGREASASTDITLKSEIYSYSRSRGLFAGAALDGSSITLDNEETAAYYRGTGILQGDGPPGQPPMLPPSAAQLLETIAAYSKSDVTPGPAVIAAPGVAAVPATPAPGGPIQSPPLVSPTPVPGPAAANPAADLQTVRGQLAASSRKLGTIVDPNWQRYLALPQEVFTGDRQPSAQSIATSIDRFNTVATDAKYRTLAQRPEFQETFNLLKAFRDLQAATGTSTLPLPPPPR
jgi:SH3 domain-containing YSC84-like protein 1